MTTPITTNEDWNCLLALAESGDSTAQYEVALHYDSGLVAMGIEVVVRSQSEAFKWYYRAFKKGNLEAITRVADFLSEGVHCEQNIELAIKLYQKGIDNGYSYAANNLATVYRDMNDFKSAFEFYKVAQSLSKSGSLSLALCHYFGIGTEKNVKMSFEIFHNISKDKSEFRNCQYDIDEANYFLGRIYLEGEIIEKSVINARAFLKLANTDNDHRSAQELLNIIGKND